MRRDDLCHTIRQSLVRLPAPYDSHYGVVPPPLSEDPVSIGQAASQVSSAMAALGRVDGIAANLNDAYLISRVLTRQEAVASSSIEGTNSTLDELLAVEEGGGAEAGAAAKQVRDYALALDELVPLFQKNGPSEFTADLLSRLHRRVMQDDPDYKDVPGALRTRVVWIGGNDIAYSTFNPPPPDHLQGCLVPLIDYLRNQGMQSMTQGLITRMALAHAQFEAIHPFRDGNGRVGRLLLPLMMAAAGHTPLYLSPFIETRKDGYIKALKAAQQQLTFEDLAGFLADAMVTTVDELLATRSALSALRDDWLTRRNFRRDSASFKALDHLPHYPVLTVSRLAEILDVSFKTASVAADQLVDARILTERTGYARNRMFAAKEALSIINRPFGAEPVLP